MGIGSFPELKRPGVSLTTHPHLTPRLRKEESYTTAPTLRFRGLFWGELYLYHRYQFTAREKNMKYFDPKADIACEL